MIVARTSRELTAIVERVIGDHAAGEGFGTKTHVRFRSAVIAVWGGPHQRHPKTLGECNRLGYGPPYFGVVFGESRNEKIYQAIGERGVGEAVRDVMTWFIGQEISEGADCEKLINQGIRVCEVIRINRTRCRLRYRMPNAGVMEGWHAVTRLFGRTLLTITDLSEFRTERKYKITDW